MSDIVERLRNGGETCGLDRCRVREAKSGCTCAEAADTITTLRAENERLRDEVQTWIVHANNAIWSDSEECKLLTRINAALLEAPTVDVDVVVPERDYSAMTPKDCYEAGLLDGVYQAREAIKAAARAALAEEKKG